MLMSMPRMIAVLKDAGCIPENAIASLETTRRRFPATREPRIKELAIGGPVIPDGDRRHGPQSGSVVDQILALKGNQDVMRVLVLSQNGFHGQGRAHGAAPIQGSFERGLPRDCARKMISGVRIKMGVVYQRNVAHNLIQLRVLLGA